MYDLIADTVEQEFKEYVHKSGTAGAATIASEEAVEVKNVSTISVISGVYNCKSTDSLKVTIDSLIRQQYEDWEYILCDDGSTDSTRELLNEVAQVDSRIKVIGYDKNRGLPFALNTCLAEASGLYIARQDVDDISEPDRLSRQFSFLEAHPEYALVGSCASVFDGAGVWGEYRMPEAPTKDDFLRTSPFLHPSVLFRREALRAVDGYHYGPRYDRVEDYDLFMRIYAHGMQGWNIQKNLYGYRIDRDAVRSDRMRHRFNRSRVCVHGFSMLGLFPKGIPYVVKPLAVGLIPKKLYNRMKRKQYAFGGPGPGRL